MLKTFRAYIVLLVLIFPVLCFGQKSDTQNVKIKNYLDSMNLFVEKCPSIWALADTVAYKEFVAIYDTLTDTESLEIQDELSKDSDVKQVKINFQSPQNIKENQWKTFLVFFFTQTRLLRKWDEEMNNKESVLMQKIFPIIIDRRYSPDLKEDFILHSDSYMRNIHNMRISFPDDHRNLILDKFIEIFSDNQNPDSLRQSAAKTWIIREKRKKIFWQRIDYLENYPSIFEKSAQGMVFNIFIERKKVKEKMFNILERRKDPLIVQTILNCFENFVRGKPDERKEIKEKFKMLRDKEGDKELKTIYDEHLR